MPVPMNLRLIVRGSYDLQALRIQMGNRLIGNFKAKLGQAPGQSEDSLDDASKKLLGELRSSLPKISDVILTGEEAIDDEVATDDERKAAKVGKLIVDLVSKRYAIVTEGRKTFPTRASFKGDPVISDYTELSLVAQYVDLEKQEKQGFNRLNNILPDYPIFVEFLDKVSGCGPMMSGVILSEIDIHKARYPSSLWKYAGLDCGPDGRGRSRRAEHLVDRTYIDKNGNQAVRKGITFSPFLKTKCLGVLGPSFIKVKDSPYKTIYYNYKHRLENHAVYGIANEGAKDENGHKITSKGRRHAMAIRYCVKMFLLELYKNWRALEKLPVAPPYSEAKLGMPPHRGGESAA